MKKNNSLMVSEGFRQPPGQSKPKNIMVSIKKLGRPVFTTHELITISGKLSSTIIQSLNRLVRQGLLIKIYRGVWAEAGAKGASAFEIIPCLFPRQRVYVSFISALHLYGIIEQIPQTITLASTAHTSTIRTKAGVFEVHQIAPAIFGGFDWYNGEGSFLVAEPEKALIDSLYLSSRKKKQFGHFPELHFPREFSFNKAAKWVKRIPEEKIRLYVFRKLEGLKKNL
ncbi:MAG: type IV toxin-antitoxin system AbiEi family antitoxin domain-containing protein [Candidatus Omnitrophota bacterium]|nr:type IV toxin-antitoxin system AbiEi family antitoxin domain-containing protein [Candidatus Omnitrophota bacterium]